MVTAHQITKSTWSPIKFYKVVSSKHSERYYWSWQRFTSLFIWMQACSWYTGTREILKIKHVAINPYIYRNGRGHTKTISVTKPRRWVSVSCGGVHHCIYTYYISVMVMSSLHWALTHLCDRVLCYIHKYYNYNSVKYNCVCDNLGVYV